MCTAAIVAEVMCRYCSTVFRCHVNSHSKSFFKNYISTFQIFRL